MRALTARTLLWLAAMLTPLQGLPVYAGTCRCGTSGTHQCPRAAEVPQPDGERQQCCQQKDALPPCCRAHREQNPACCRTKAQEAAPVPTCCQGAAVCRCQPGDSSVPAVPPVGNAPQAKDLCCPAVVALAPVSVDVPPAPQSVADASLPPTPLERCSTLCRFVL